MKLRALFLGLVTFGWSASPVILAQTAVSRADRGMPLVTATRQGGGWVIAGQHQTVTLDASTLAIHIKTEAAAWDLAPSGSTDLQLRVHGVESFVRLADAQKIAIVPYDTGYKTGVKLTLSDWPKPGAPGETFGPTLYLTICLEGNNEDLVFDVAADERHAAVHQLDWPAALDASSVDYTVLPTGRGTLLPRHWPKAYNPVRPGIGAADVQSKVKMKDTSIIQSNLIECWSMAWWGFVKGRSAMMVIVETPDDAAYQFSHPAGGPTVIGPRWRESLGRLAYMRTARMCFVARGNYVDLAKRYRRYVIDSGQFVPLTEKIARTPSVRRLIGTPMARISILRNPKPDGWDYAHATPEQRYDLHTFDERARELRDDKAHGVDRPLVVLTGWPHEGYDRQHPDELPPPEAAGGWAGMKRLVDTCRELGYLIMFHDQYRDYYVDAPSYDPQFAVHEEDAATPPTAFPGTRFGGGWKEGQIPFMDHWEGGKQTYLTPSLVAGHLRKNYAALAAHGIAPDGVYLDVFGYVPPDEDFDPGHPATRADSMRARIACYNWVRARLGIVGTEAGCDWTMPYVDIASPVMPSRCIEVPLYNLVYHDAIITQYATTSRKAILRGILHGGVPNLGPQAIGEADSALIAQMAALHRRIALVEMTNHEFLDANYRRERTTFADGTTVTVDWDQQTVAINPKL